MEAAKGLTPSSMARWIAPSAPRLYLFARSASADVLLAYSCPDVASIGCAERALYTSGKEFVVRSCLAGTTVVPVRSAMHAPVHVAMPLHAHMLLALASYGLTTRAVACLVRVRTHVCVHATLAGGHS